MNDHHRFQQHSQSSTRPLVSNPDSGFFYVRCVVGPIDQWFENGLDSRDETFESPNQCGYRCDPTLVTYIQRCIDSEKIIWEHFVLERHQMANPETIEYEDEFHTVTTHRWKSFF